LSAKQLGRTAKALLERGVKQLSRPRSCCGQPVMQAMVAAVLVDTIDSLELSWPEVSEQARAANAEARRKLAAEPDDKPG
jgi:hypothetical protein